MGYCWLDERGDSRLMSGCHQYPFEDCEYLDATYRYVSGQQLFWLSLYIQHEDVIPK